MANTAELTPRQATTNAWFAYSGAIVAQTGVQLVAPSLPLMRDALGLSDSRLALVMSVYLLPAAIGAIPAGILADRIGRRRVFGWSMVVFGIAGIALQMATSSFGLFLSIRFLQGLAFAGLLPLTMTILGDAFRGADLIRGQGRRSVSMLVGDGTLPIIGGVLAAAAWQVPWLGQILAIPFGFAVLGRMTDPPSLRRRSQAAPSFATFAALFRMRGVMAVQYAGFLRMFLKFSILTYLPVLLVDARGFSPAFAGLVVGASALIGIVPSASAGRIAHLARPTTFVAVGLALEGVALAVWAVATWPGVILAAAFGFGLADGLSGVFVNALVASATDTEQRASFVAVTGAVRNFAKFAGPAFVGIAILSIDLSTAIVLMAVTTFVSTLLVIPLRSLDARLQDEQRTEQPHEEAHDHR